MVTTETDPRLSLLPTRLTALGGTDPTWRKRVHLRGREREREGGRERGREQSEKENEEKEGEKE